MGLFSKLISKVSNIWDFQNEKSVIFGQFLQECENALVDESIASLYTNLETMELDHNTITARSIYVYLAGAIKKHYEDFQYVGKGWDRSELNGVFQEVSTKCLGLKMSQSYEEIIKNCPSDGIWNEILEYGGDDIIHFMQLGKDGRGKNKSFLHFKIKIMAYRKDNPDF